MLSNINASRIKLQLQDTITYDLQALLDCLTAYQFTQRGQVLWSVLAIECREIPLIKNITLLQFNLNTTIYKNRNKKKLKNLLERLKHFVVKNKQYCQYILLFIIIILITFIASTLHSIPNINYELQHRVCLI